MTLCDRLIAAGAAPDYATWKVARDIEQVSELNRLREENELLRGWLPLAGEAPPVKSPFTPLEEMLVRRINGDTVAAGVIMQHARHEGFNQASAAVALTRLVRAGILERPEHGHYRKLRK